MMEERARLLHDSGKLRTPYQVVIGQEATEIGTTLQLEAGDTVAPSRHNLFTYVVEGTPVRDVMASLLTGAIKDGTTSTNPSRALRLIAPLMNFAAQLNIATGVALANAGPPRREEQSGVVLAFAAGGDDDAGAWHESLVLAGELRLPIVYVLENTHWSTHVPFSRQGMRSNEALIARAEKAGVPSITVDGNDAVAMYRVAHEALHRARLRRGATFINAQTSPWRKNVVTDAAHPRTAEEIEHWQGRDPLAHMEMYMTWYGVWSNQWKQKLVEQVSADIKDALSNPARRKR